MYQTFSLACLMVVVGLGDLYGQEPTDSISGHLAVFRPLVGKTWLGTFANSTPEKPMHDVSRWERAMNGQAIRVLHSVNDGEYGGETILMWDAQREKIAFWYFTTAGFFTEGTMDVDGKTWSSVEEVTGNANGITQVKSTSRILENGDMHMKSEYFAKGQWTPGHEIHYQYSPDSEVKFK